MDTGLVFGIIFAIIVIGLLLVFGMGQIADIFCVTNTAQVQKAVKDLEQATEDVYNLGQGSSMPFKISLPRNARLCFVDYENPEPQKWHPEPDLYDIVKSQINASRANLWIIYGCGSHKHTYRISYLRTAENFCADSGDNIYLENMGRYVAVEPA